MTQNTWLVTDKNRARALIKYELNDLKTCLRKQLDAASNLKGCSAKIVVLCGTLAHKYRDYLRLLDDKTSTPIPKLSFAPYSLEHFKLIFNLETKLTKTVDVEEMKRLIVEIIALYQLVIPEITEPSLSAQSHELNQLFREPRLDLWLVKLIAFWNQHDEVSTLFHDWSTSQQQIALDFFANEKFIDLVNAIFFYKLYPDKLFVHSIHAEKLVSVRTRIGVLHHHIEFMQEQLHHAAAQHGLKPAVDHFFHGDELPKGVLIDVNEEFREMIQTAIKQLKAIFTPQTANQVNLDRVQDLGRAYAFWFNPNRFIDAVMVLQQNLVPETMNKEPDLIAFQQEMLMLFGQLTTTECLDLYGYFANNDSRYLLYTFYAIAQGVSFDWLPLLEVDEKVTISDVFNALCSVLEALRCELKNRQVTTAAYAYDLDKESAHIGRRNRDAVFRAMALYGRQSAMRDDILAELFNIVEEAE